MAGPAASIIRQIVLPSRCLLRGWLALIVLIVLAGSGLIAAEPLSLDNAGFEQGSAQWLLKPGSVTAEIAPDCNFSHSGQASLRLSAAAADNPYAAQLVGRIEPLATYRLAAMVRAAEGSRAVAAVRIEFYDGGNRNISVWRQQLRTNPDGTWQAIEQTATAEAAGVNAVVVLRLAGPGELWFDDVELTVVSPGPELWAIPSELAITADRPDTIAFDLHLDQQTKSAPPLQFSINCPAMVERIVPDFRLDRANDQILSVLLTLPALLPGLYTLGIVRTDTGAVGQANVVVIPADCRSQAIRSDGVIPVGGEPFFPICARWGDATEFEALQTAGFNTVECLPMDDLERLGQLLDAAQEHHLKAIVPLYDSTDSPKALADCAKKVERFADHPALLAWKLMHLPTVHPDWRKPAIEAFLHLKQTSPDKPVVVGIGNPVQYRRWVDFLDWLEVICYPGSGGAPSTVAELTEQARRDAHPGQAVYATLPAAVGEALSSRRMMVYLALIAGAQGIGWRGPSSATDEGELLRQVNAEAAQLGRALVGGETAQVACSTDRLRYRAVKHDGAILTMVANTTEERVVARIQLPEVAGMVKWLHADNTPAALSMLLRLSRDGRVVTFALPGGQCDTVVATLR